MKVRGGHPFGLMQISKIAKFKWFKWQKIWCTLSIIYSINPRGCPPLRTTSLGQAYIEGKTRTALEHTYRTDVCT